MALLIAAPLVKLGVALLPGLPAPRRIALGLLAFPIVSVVTVVKVIAYDEPESGLFLIVDAVLLLLLLLARRADRLRVAPLPTA
ncbi:hypothetical protein GB883_14735 [Georgenia thermotolerans]|uniref:Uncharacterized protein n=1 Tax=Georgenia thermotolerans TaxID=527326 RepID=A0A7J5UMK1_9MICO|nr:hypothetical protein GB883_14735 [Georgenia thermotolerans]